MRRRMHAEHPNRSPQFDVKHDPGGMVDVEFIVQYLVLAHSHARPELTANVGNIALLALGAQLDLLPEPLAAAAADAYREYRRLQHQRRLQGAAEARVDAEPLSEYRRAVGELWTTVFHKPWNHATQISESP
jgi:[glutamine synthetase] adenylyltransferase / [glutamine synthetase]-adenylyl-L-tyrosine phosphorylase